MAIFDSCHEYFRDCTPPDELFDYGLFIPGDEFRPIPVSEASSESGSISGDEKRRRRAEAKKREEEEAAVAALVQKDELQERFEKHSGGKNTMNTQQAAAMAREMGFAPSEADIKKLEEQKGSNISYKDVQEFLVASSHPEDTPEHLLEFFQHYDVDNSGKLTRKQIKNLLQNFGEPLTEKEVDAVFSSCGVTSDPVDYHQFVQKLLGK